MRVVVAGTFGPIHDGHRALFRAALEHGDEGIVVGLTSDALANRTRNRPVPSYEDRERTVRREIDAIDEWNRDPTIVKLSDEYGVAVEDPSLDAIVVSPETRDEVAEINERRIARGIGPLETILVPFVRADDGERISSTRVVRGEIDEHGEVTDTR
ncbi:MAG: phosphopantetheine adenylyltransferase [Halobacteriota archaeon]